MMNPEFGIDGRCAPDYMLADKRNPQGVTSPALRMCRRHINCATAIHYGGRQIVAPADLL